MADERSGWVKMGRPRHWLVKNDEHTSDAVVRSLLTVVAVLAGTVLAALAAIVLGLIPKDSTAGRVDSLGDTLLTVAGAIGSLAGLLVAAVIFGVQSVSGRLGRLGFLVPLLVRRLLFLELSVAVLTIAGSDLIAGAYSRLSADSLDAIGPKAILATAIFTSVLSVIAACALLHRSLSLIGRDLTSAPLSTFILDIHRNQRLFSKADSNRSDAYLKSLETAGWEANPYAASFGKRDWIYLRADGQRGQIAQINVRRLVQLRKEIIKRLGGDIDICIIGSAHTDHKGVVAAFKARNASLLAVADNLPHDVISNWSRDFRKAIRVDDSFSGGRSLRHYSGDGSIQTFEEQSSNGGGSLSSLVANTSTFRRVLSYRAAARLGKEERSTRPHCL